jgi:predicted nucleotide-binding protein (sugar kinase/HSP70/actin superfamily)
MPFRHEHVVRKIGPDHPLAGKKVFIPQMPEGSSEAFAAVFRWLGIDAAPTAPSNQRTRELGQKYTNGDECYPAIVTVGDFLRVLEEPGVDPAHVAFFQPTAEGPCRFGQYAHFLRRVLDKCGYREVTIVSPSSENGYADLGSVAGAFVRAGWRALVAGDLLHRALLCTRPYETLTGAADAAYQESLRDFCETLEASCADAPCQLRALVGSMTRAHERFRSVPAYYDPDVPLIGVVGEIFCRLNSFSNEDLIRKLESYGAETWLSHIGEWIAYTNADVVRKLRLRGRAFSFDRLKASLRSHVQLADEHALAAPFGDFFAGREEPEDIREILDLARPYLPCEGALGEMVLSVGKAAYLARKGADGVVDISPFTCMNGIVSEAIYPKLSRDYGGIPIRNFYFDGTQSDLERDLGIYLELARSYREKKPWKAVRSTRRTQPVG